jgi:outer membrane protein OmpA-like peptidoglycan-associated protein
MLALGAGLAQAQGRLPQNDQTIYCSGIYSTEDVPRETYLISGEESRSQTTFHQGDWVYLNKGSSAGVKVGDEFTIVRRAKDTNGWTWFSWQRSLQRAMGKYWKDVGRIRVINVQGDTSTAEIVFSCDWFQRGDLAVRWEARPAPEIRRAKFDPFAPATGGNGAMVVDSKDFSGQVGTGDTVFVNQGSSQGVKVGDWFRVYRYQGTRAEHAYINMHYAHRTLGFGKTPRWYRWNEMPREIVGQGIVLRTSPNSSVVLLTYAAREIYLGDYVEPMTPEFEAAPAPPPAPAPAPRANRSPSMNCSAERQQVTAGERVRISARASDPDGDPLTYAWRANAGQVVGSGSSVMLDTTGLRPGRYVVTGQASDGISAAADCSVEVTVQPAAAPAQATKANECIFRLASAGVDNVCKRILDDVALRLKNEPQARVALIGYADPEESGAARLATQRADNARQYLVSSGIASARVDTRTASGQAGAGRQNRRVDIIWVPAGATY